MSFLNFFLSFLFLTPFFLSIAQYFLGRIEDTKNLSYVNLAGTFMATLIFSGLFLGVPLSSSWSLNLFSVHSLELTWGGEINEISSVFLLVCMWLNVFSKILIERFLWGDNASQARLFLYLDLFLVAAFITISATFFFPLFLGWELLGIVSYLLLSFFYESASSNQAAFTAFLYDKVGSVFLLLGGSLMIFSYGDISFSDGQWSLIRESFIGICFFISIYCKLFQFGVNTWVSRSVEIPSSSLSIVANFLFGIPAFILLWRLRLLEVDFLKSISLYLGIVTFVFATGMALMDPVLKKITSYLTIAYWGLILVFSTFGFYKISFACVMVLSVMQFILFGVEKALSSKNKEPIFLWGASSNNFPGWFFIGLLALLAVCHSVFLWVMGVFILGSGKMISWGIEGGIAMLAMAIWRLVFLLGNSYVLQRERYTEGGKDQLWNAGFLSLSAMVLVGGLLCFWLCIKAPLMDTYFSEWINSAIFVGSGIILGGGNVFLFTGVRRAIEKKASWGYQVVLRQAYLETFYNVGLVKTFKWISSVLSEKVDGFLIEEQAFSGSISSLNRMNRLIAWVQTQTFSFYLLFLLLSCLGLLFFFMLK